MRIIGKPKIARGKIVFQEIAVNKVTILRSMLKCIICRRNSIVYFDDITYISNPACIWEKLYKSL